METSHPPKLFVLRTMHNLRLPYIGICQYIIIHCCSTGDTKKEIERKEKGKRGRERERKKRQLKKERERKSEGKKEKNDGLGGKGKEKETNSHLLLYSLSILWFYLLLPHLFNLSHYHLSISPPSVLLSLD